MNISEKILIAEDIFKQIDSAATNQDYDKCFKLLNSPQPDQWLSSKKSDFTDGYYLFNEAELIEKIMDRLFYFTFKIDTPIFIQQETKTSVTLTSLISYTFKKDSQSKIFYSSGIATETVENFAALKLASPACKTYSFKSACAYIGELLGKGINRIENGIQADTTQNKALNTVKKIINNK